MSANFSDPRPKPSKGPHQWPRPPALGLDTTTDVHDENTTDLDPQTADVDFVPGESPRPTLAEAKPRRPRVEPPAPIVAREITPPPAEAREVEPPAPIRAESLFMRRSGMVPTPTIKPDPIASAGSAQPYVKREPFVSTPIATARPASPTVAITVDVALEAAPTPTVAARPGTPSTAITVDVQADAPFAPLANVSSASEPAALKSVAPVTQPLALAPGKVLCDRYLLEQVIGCGGTAIVFRARDMLSANGAAPNKQVAVKTPRPELGDMARAAMRLKHEFDHARLLSHPSIVRVLELREDDGRPFMTMELVEGRLLSTLLRDWTMLPASLAYKILRQCAQALRYAHSQNVVHGDFKPGNVFITPEEGVRIVDFGTAAGPNTNESRIPAGTPTYASPEVLGGDTPDRRDDVFSFACVAYEVLTGQHPFGRLSSLQARDEGKIPPRAWNLSTSQWLSLLSALSWKREQRPTDVEELLNRLNPEQPVVALPAPIHVDPEEIVPAELPADLMPKQRSWGFFAFIACALLVSYFAYQRHAPDAPAANAPAIVPAAATLPPAPIAAPLTPPVVEATAESESTTPEAAAPVQAAPVVVEKRTARPAAPKSEISFESSSIVTSENSVAAVFLIKRSQPLSGRVSVSWKALSGTADAGIDFASSAAGTVTFADGQAQRAIYVPLRSDLLKEEDETFYVELSSPKSSKLGKVARAEAIIRDDD